MNTEQIRQLVAEKVMGLTTQVVESGYSSAWKSGELIYLNSDGDTWSVVPDYPSDIADAWEVVSDLLRNGWRVDVINDLFQGAPWVVCVVHYGADEEDVVDAEAPSAALAICLAALRAVGVEVPE